MPTKVGCVPPPLGMQIINYDVTNDDAATRMW